MKQQHEDSIDQIFTCWAVVWGIFYLIILYVSITNEFDPFNVGELIVAFIFCLFGWAMTSLVWMLIDLGSITKVDLHNKLSDIENEIKKGQ